MNYKLSTLAAFFLLLLSSCQNKTKKFLVKKWDCVRIENLAPIDQRFATAQDSAIAVKTEAALKALSWTFESNNTYHCSTLGNIVTVQGTYGISEDEKTLTLTSLSKNTTNVYTITSISDFEMTLTNNSTKLPLILHFSPN